MLLCVGVSGWCVRLVVAMVNVVVAFLAGEVSALQHVCM